MGITTSSIGFFKRPIVLIVIAALLIRLVLMPLLTYDFDIYHWALIISNIDSGNNLYDLDGYYYTPVWGYMLGFISSVEQFLVNIGPSGIRFTDMLPIENLEYQYHTATITSIAFNVCMKIPLIMCDVAVGYLVYWLVKDRTGDSKKATYGVALWFFCPIVIYMSSVQAMFDTFSALLLLLTVIMLYKDHCFIGGALFSMAVLLKFFPGFCIFVMIAYIIVKHKEDGLVKRKLLETILGAAVMACILMLPLILNGQVDNAFTFVFGRVGEAALAANIFTMFNLAIGIFCAIFFGYKMYRTPKEKADSSMFMYILFTVAASTLISTTPQYVIVMIPFLILHILSADRTYLKLWMMIGIAAFFGAFILNNYSLFAALSEYTGTVQPSWLISGMQYLESGFFGIDLTRWLTTIANWFQYIGLLLLVMFALSDDINRKMPKIGNMIMRIKGKETDTNEA